MIHLLKTKLKRHDLYEIILSVLTSRCLHMKGKGENGSFPSLPPPEIVINLIKNTQALFQNESSLLRLNFTQHSNDSDKHTENISNQSINKYIVVGDLHGNVDDLLRIFEDNSYPPDAKYVFTGDYVDRGSCSLEIMLLLFALKNLYPKHIFLLRGNHESQDICSVYGFQNECELKYPNSLFTDNNDLTSSSPSNNANLASSRPIERKEDINNGSTDDQDVIELDSGANDESNEDHEKDDYQPTFLDLEINLNSISLPSLFSSTSANSTDGETESTKMDVENECFNFENYHYYNDNEESYINDNDGAVSFYSQSQNSLPNKVFEAFTEAFSYMPFSAVIANQIFCVHGGISPDVSYLEQIEEIKRPCLTSENLVSNGILWSDPRSDLPIGEGTGNGFEPSDRGTGYLFNEARLNDFLKANHLTYLIRSHEPCEEGVNKPFGDDGRCITVFSNSDYCGMENNAAVVQITPKDSSFGSTSLSTSSSSSASFSSSSNSEYFHAINVCNNNSVSIAVENLSITDNNNNHDNNIYNDINDNDREFVKDSVSINFRFYEPLHRNDLSMRRIIIPEWIFSNMTPKPELNHFSNIKYHYHENDLLSSLIEEPVDLFYSGI